MPMPNNDTYSIPTEDTNYPVKVARVCDDDGTFVCLSCNADDGENSFFFRLSPQNAATLGRILLLLARKR